MDLPQPLRAVLDRLVDVARADPRIVGVTVGGSGATATTDAWSDLDTVIVCRDAAVAAAVQAECRALAARLGPLVSAFTGEHVGEPRLLIALYAPPPLHVDLKVVAVDDLATRVEDGAIAWERDGAVSAAYAEAPAAWPAVDPQWIEDRYWTWVHYVATKIGRGELLEAVDALAMLRQLALGPLVALRDGRPAAGVRRLEQLAPADAQALAATIGDHTPTGALAALRAAVEAYRRLSDHVAVERRVAAEEAAVAFLDTLPRDAQAR
jgi:hypothetical protein